MNLRICFHVLRAKDVWRMEKSVLMPLPWMAPPPVFWVNFHYSKDATLLYDIQVDQYQNNNIHFQYQYIESSSMRCSSPLNKVQVRHHFRLNSTAKWQDELTNWYHCFFDESVPLTADRFVAANFIQKRYLVVCPNTPKLIKKLFDEEVHKSIVEFGRCFFWVNCWRFVTDFIVMQCYCMFHTTCLSFSSASKFTIFFYSIRNVRYSPSSCFEKCT